MGGTRPSGCRISLSRIVTGRQPRTNQQHIVPVLVRHAGLGAMEAGITADDHVEGALALCGVVRNPAPTPDGWRHLDPAASEPDDLIVWGDCRVPLLHVAKLRMAEVADRAGFRQNRVCSMSGRHPTIFGNPCGVCGPCTVTREAGVRWRLPEPMPMRRGPHRIKGRMIARRDVLRANWTPASRMVQ